MNLTYKIANKKFLKARHINEKNVVLSCFGSIERIITILCNLYFVVALKCIDAKSTGVPNQLFPSNCIAHSNQSTKPSFAIYQNVFKGKIILTNSTMHEERVEYNYVNINL